LPPPLQYAFLSRNYAVSWLSSSHPVSNLSPLSHHILLNDDNIFQLYQDIQVEIAAVRKLLQMNGKKQDKGDAVAEFWRTILKRF
jgi:hypothetical protein